MFSSEYRERVTAELVEKSRSDPRIVAAAFVGSSASGGDRWSDLDLTFGVAENATVDEVLDSWTRRMVEDYGAVVLFDVSIPYTIYRVFLLPGALQVDLSFSLAAQFGARGPRFQIIFGNAVELQWAAPFSPHHNLGMAMHHAVRAHICIERERLWQAEYWIQHARELAMSLACDRRGLDPGHGRGFDQLPSEVHTEFAGMLVKEMTESAIRNALAQTTIFLLGEADFLGDEFHPLQQMLQEICLPESV